MIRGTIGRGGSGKSLYTISRLWALHTKHNRPIYSNTPLIDLRVRWGFGFDASTGQRIGPMWVPVNPRTFGEDWADGYIYKFEDIYDLDNCECLIDEIGAWMPSHKWSKMPDEVRNFLHQDRREGVNVWWTHRTSRIFHEVLENTAEIGRCARYGPLVVCSLSDPQARDEKPVKKFLSVKPGIFDLYQTLARVGSSDGKGYGLGKRTGYRSPDGLRMLKNYGPHGVSIFVRPEQLACIIRKFGPEYVTLEREEGIGVKWSWNV